MRGAAIEKAAELADIGELSVDAALLRYEQARSRNAVVEADQWVSTAFLISRHERMGREPLG